MANLSIIVSFLLADIEIQNSIINYLTALLFGKTISRANHDEPTKKPYRKLQVDALPIIEIPEKLNYRQPLIDYQHQLGKPLAPIKPHKDSKAYVPNTLTCLKCTFTIIFLRSI